ncbi:MAG: cobalamin biosynthesis protein [Desulfovibrio sp.]|jgi:adenosylcobinamide-phosphate synthase|nr:cobalamin biosynthesis protein [Desulfovibrio sp.]
MTVALSSPLSTLFPYAMWDCWWLAPVALALDALLADPRLPWPHPVVLVGRLLRALETPARRLERRGAGKAAGLACVLLLACCTGLSARLLIALPFVGPVLAVYLAWAGLALGCLLKTGAEAADKVWGAPLSEARRTVSMLVSRDVSRMDSPVLAKTLADTLSENFTDAFLAPWFWLLAAGPVGLWCYKAVSTADSMWGYKTELWRDLGWAGARGDDMLAFIPARLSVPVLWLTDILVRLFHLNRPWRGRWPGFRLVSRQADGMHSPNSGLPMTACAWLCDAPMAGPSVYFGELVEKPWLGPPRESAGQDWDAGRLRALLSLLKRAACVGGGLYFFSYFFRL